MYFNTIVKAGLKLSEISALDVAASMTWATKAADGSVTPDTSLICRFLTSVFGSAGEDKEDGGVTSASYLAVKKAVPWFLNLQIAALGRATSMPKGYVNTIPGVKEMDKNLSSHNSIRALQEQEDLQADQDPDGLNLKGGGTRAATSISVFPKFPGSLWPPYLPRQRAFFFPGPSLCVTLTQ